RSSSRADLPWRLSSTPALLPSVPWHIAQVSASICAVGSVRAGTLASARAQSKARMAAVIIRSAVRFRVASVDVHMLGAVLRLLGVMTMHRAGGCQVQPLHVVDVGDVRLDVRPARA